MKNTLILVLLLVFGHWAFAQDALLRPMSLQPLKTAFAKDPKFCFYVDGRSYDDKIPEFVKAYSDREKFYHKQFPAFAKLTVLDQYRYRYIDSAVEFRVSQWRLKTPSSTGIPIIDLGTDPFCQLLPKDIRAVVEFRTGDMIRGRSQFLAGKQPKKFEEFKDDAWFWVHTYHILDPMMFGDSIRLLIPDEEDIKNGTSYLPVKLAREVRDMWIRSLVENRVDTWLDAELKKPTLFSSVRSDRKFFLDYRDWSYKMYQADKENKPTDTLEAQNPLLKISDWEFVVHEINIRELIRQLILFPPAMTRLEAERIMLEDLYFRAKREYYRLHPDEDPKNKPKKTTSEKEKLSKVEPTQQKRQDKVALAEFPKDFIDLVILDYSYFGRDEYKTEQERKDSLRVLQTLVKRTSEMLESEQRPEYRCPLAHFRARLAQLCVQDSMIGADKTVWKNLQDTYEDACFLEDGGKLFVRAGDSFFHSIKRMDIAVARCRLINAYYESPTVDKLCPYPSIQSHFRGVNGHGWVKENGRDVYRAKFDPQSLFLSEEKMMGMMEWMKKDKEFYIGHGLRQAIRDWPRSTESLHAVWKESPHDLLGMNTRVLLSERIGGKLPRLTSSGEVVGQ